MDTSSHHINTPALPSQEDVILAKESSRKLAMNLEAKEIMNLKIHNREGEEVSLELPASAVRLLLDILEQMANGNAIRLTPLHAELTSSQAAELLNISRPFLIKLLDEGKIPFRKVGSHRRLLAEDVLAYKQESYARRTQALNELTAQAQELNWGYD